MKKVMIAAIVSAAGLVYIDTSSVTTVDTTCVNVYTDFGALKPSVTSQCIPVGGVVPGSEVLAKAGYATLGTTKYPSQVVCRVNGLPTPAVDPCKTMPPADAYWAILVENKGKWDWATTGIDGVTLKNGEGIGLVYATQGKVKFPTR